MNLEKFLNQAMSIAEEAAKSPLGHRVKDQVEKGMMAASALSQSIPSQEQIAQLIEEKSPHLAQTFLSYASEVGSPIQIGMGMKILSLTDEGVRVSLPNRWRNRGLSGAIHPAALMTAAEFSGRSYWERLVDRKLGEVRLLEVQARFHKPTYRQVVAQLHLAGEERERVLFDLRKNGRVTVETTVIIFGKSDQRIADFALLWEIESQIVLDQNQTEN